MGGWCLIIKKKNPSNFQPYWRYSKKTSTACVNFRGPCSRLHVKIHPLEINDYTSVSNRPVLLRQTHRLKSQDFQFSPTADEVPWLVICLLTFIYPGKSIKNYFLTYNIILHFQTWVCFLPKGSLLINCSENRKGQFASAWSHKSWSSRSAQWCMRGPLSSEYKWGRISYEHGLYCTMCD